MMTLLRWLARRVGTSTLVTLMLLWLAFASAVYAFRAIVRGFDDTSALGLITLALLVGWLLARSNFPGGFVALLGAILGIELVFVRVGQLTDKLIAFAQTWVVIARDVVHVPRGASLDFVPMLRAFDALVNALMILLVRSRDWLGAMMDGSPTFDPVASALAWGLLAWFVACWASWHTLRRHNVVTAFVPGLVLLAGALSYVGGNPDLLLPLLICLLLLLVVRAQSEREQRWQTTQVPTAEDIPFDLAMVGVLLSVTLLLCAALVPSFSFDDVIRAIQDVTRERIEVNRMPESFGLQPALATRAPTIFDVMRSPGMPTRHLIGTGAELSRQVVMTIQTNDTQVLSPDEYVAPPHYWRSTTYDIYTGRGWLTSETEIIDYPAGEFANSANDTAHRVVQQDVRRVREANNLLFATGILVTTDHDYRVAWRASDDVFSAELRAPNYRAASRVLALDEAQLRKTGSNYPADIRARYLALPNDVPVRVLNLARDLTATQPTPFDRARAIEKHLREFSYTLALPAPPANRDTVDYFLFNLQTGYCDYFASAMVVLSRAAGIPARLVVGYAPGSFDPAHARYMVTEADAHAWAELYFPDVGWVEFEATSNRPAMQYAPHDASDEIKLPRADETLSRLPLETPFDWRAGLVASVALVIVTMIALFAFDEWRLDRLAPEASIRKMYARFVWCAARLGVRAKISDTPNEFVEKFLRVHENKFVSDARGLIDVYVNCEYSPRKPDKLTQAYALRLWRQLRGELWRLWAQRNLQFLVRTSKFNIHRGRHERV